MKHKNILKTFLFTGLFIASAVGSFAENSESTSPERLFNRGNDYYEKSEYDKAIAEYEKVIAEGRESGALYYNLGDAYFKAGKIGKTILSYERARRFIPRDADLAANYRFARLKVQGAPAKKAWGGILGLRLFRVYSESFTIDELTYIFSGIYLLFVCLLFIMIIWPDRKRHRKVIISLFIVSTLFNFTITGNKIKNIAAGGVMIAPRTEAMFGPFDSATKFFTLYEGMKVTVLKAKDDWYKVRRSDGKVGWISFRAVERI